MATGLINIPDLAALSPTFATVGVASTVVVPANANRTGLVLINTSTNYISLAFDGAAAVLYSGVTLSPAGGVFEMDPFIGTTGQVTAIASGASSNLAIQEYI